ncbi:4a-hydroxytetrahydrobiopterin dehydratase [Candidatus Woesearchaeota archaeon]|nr:4a-hydroxytetrahydrobiopterin dehydratase [Candidatus Woesearchaeota archaeon]
MDLTQKKCEPCEGGVPPMSTDEARKLQEQVKGWGLVTVTGISNLEKKFKFKDFVEAMKFVNNVADLAESEGHHPDITINWNKVTMLLSTHAIKGLSENDFIMAAKIDKLV